MRITLAFYRLVKGSIKFLVMLKQWRVMHVLVKKGYQYLKRKQRIGFLKRVVQSDCITSWVSGYIY